MVDFGLFLGKFKRIANSKCELARKLCYTESELNTIAWIIGQLYGEIKVKTLSHSMLAGKHVWANTESKRPSHPKNEVKQSPCSRYFTIWWLKDSI